jgi:hypothetical protein
VGSFSDLFCRIRWSESEEFDDRLHGVLEGVDG